jgi:predicted nucleotidyltransferase
MVKLKGKNQIEKFRRAAEELTSQIATCEGVGGIAYLGGLVRGFADKFSDLDIIVFLTKKDDQLRRQIYDSGLHLEKQYGIDVDLEVHFWEDFKRWKWHEVDRWEFSKAKIIFDPKGAIRKIFDKKLRLPADFWIKRIAICAEYLRWYGCPSKEDVGTVAEAWIDRGALVAANYCLDYAVELLIRIIYALNREFLPAPKWRIFYSYGLKWLPENYKKLVGEAMLVKSFSVRDFSQRLKVIRKLWNTTLPKAKEETGLTTELISRYYVEKVLHQTWLPSHQK